MIYRWQKKKDERVCDFDSKGLFNILITRITHSNLLVLLDILFQLLHIGASEAVNLLAALDEHKGWHAGDVEAGGEFFVVVDIDLEYDDFAGVRLGKLLQLGGDHLAGATPGGEEVDHDQLVSGLGNLVIEVFLVQHGMYHLDWVFFTWFCDCLQLK